MAMPYPNVEGKHAYGAVYSPFDSINYRRRIDSMSDFLSPDGIVLTYQPLCLEEIFSLEEGLRSHQTIEGLYPLRSKDNKVGLFLCGPGASHVSMIMEELIARGTKKFLNIGIAGSLQKDLKVGDIVVCTRAIRDEGVSHHYINPGKYVGLSDDMTRNLRGALSKHGLSFTIGTTWTIDTPFRETQEEVKQYQAEGVLTVEMETAALASIAQYRGVQFAAAFVISDLLVDGIWKPGFDSKHLAESLKKLHEASLDVFL